MDAISGSAAAGAMLTRPSLAAAEAGSPQPAQAPAAKLPEPRVAPEFKVDAESMMRDLEKVVRSINELMDQGRSKLSFSIDRQLNRPIVRVTDSETGEVIRELPPEAMLKVARSLEDLKGVLFQGAT
jgi:flagellar protein FlaG